MIEECEDNNGGGWSWRLEITGGENEIVGVVGRSLAGSLVK